MSDFLFRLSSQVQYFLGSLKCFYLIVGFFVLTSLWVAITSLYPMAFDEDFHLGLIRLYAEHWGPFSLVQTPDADKYGSIVTDPSYLYHYIMSFPYRFLTMFTSNESVVVVLLRVLNIALFAGALFVYRKVLFAAKVSPAITHVVLGIFVLIPVVPLLAGQVNYDNLFMLIIALVLLITLRIREGLLQKNVPAAAVGWLVVLLMYGAVVKYAFLPIAFGIVLYIALLLYKTRKNLRVIARSLLMNVKAISVWQKVALVIAVSVGLVLCGQRYGSNLINYHDPVPDCSAVVSTERCLNYGPWGRDYRYAHDKQGLEAKGPVMYTLQDWSWGMWHRLFFTLAGPTNGYATRKPLPVIAYGAIVLAAVGAVLSIWYGRRIIRRYPAFVLFLLVTAIYVGALWLQVYQSHVYTARPVAINGRYLLPFLPLLGAFVGLAYAMWMRRFNIQRFQVLGVVIVFLVMLQGGSIITYVVRSEPNWFWDVSALRSANETLQDTLKPFIIGG